MTRGKVESPPESGDVFRREVLQREGGIQVAERVRDGVVHRVVDHGRRP